MPKRAPESKLRETVPGIANICMNTYTSVQPMRVATCTAVKCKCVRPKQLDRKQEGARLCMRATIQQIMQRLLALTKCSAA